MNNDSAYMAYLKKILKLRVYPTLPFIFRCLLILQSTGWGFGPTHFFDVLIIFLHRDGRFRLGLRLGTGAVGWRSTVPREGHRICFGLLQKWFWGRLRLEGDPNKKGEVVVARSWIFPSFETVGLSF